MDDTSQQAGGRQIRQTDASADESHACWVSENSLCKSEERLRRLSDNLPDSFIYQCTRDADGSPRFLYVSAGVERLNGVTAEKVLNDAGVLYRQIDPEMFSALVKAEQVSARDLSPFTMDLRLRRADGEWRWMQVRSIPSRLPDGRVVWDGVETDITERKENERELKRLNRLYAALSQVNQAIVRITSREELFQDVTRVLVDYGRFSMVWIGLVNKDTLQVEVAAQKGDETGYLSGIRIFVDERPEGRGPTGTAIREGRPYVCNDFLDDPRTAPWREAAARAGWRSSAAFPISSGAEVCGALMVYDREANFFGEREVELIEEVVQDISFGLLNIEREAQRNQTEAALRRSEEKFRDLFESAPIGIFQSTIDGRFLRVNATLVGMFGYGTPEEMVSAVTDIAPQIFVIPGQRKEIINSALETDTFARNEILYRRRDGTVFMANLSMRVVRDDGGDVAFLEGFVEDISERKHAEREITKLNSDLEQRVRSRTAELEVANSALKQEIEFRKNAQKEIIRLNLDLVRQKAALETVNKELESFSYSVSHDLRAPLRHLEGFAKILEEDCAPKLDDSERDCLRRIRAAATRMEKLVDALLQLSRMTRTEISLEPVDISGMATAIVDELAKSWPDRNVAVTIEDGIVVMADPRLLRIVMDNLIGNAWKYTSKKEGALIQIATTEVEGRRACFVRDNGAGFNMAYVGKLFGAFQRLHSEAEFEGIGIGLATVQRIIHLHGGDIWAEGREGEGATFYFTLQLSDSAQF